MIHGKNYIAGKFQSPNTAINPQRVFSAFNPCTEEVIGIFPQTDDKTVQSAIAAARNVQPAWRNLGRVKRAEYFDKLASVMKDHKDKIVDTISLEIGKNLNESEAEFNEALHMVQYTFAQGRESVGTMLASEIAEKDISVFRKPKGVVAVIAPWNFPAAILGFWTSAPALLEGNTVVCKPSEDSPLTGDLIAMLYDKAGFPPGVFNMVHGDGRTGKALVEGDVDHICFTGSAAVGKLIRQHCATTWHKSCSCEMGSKSAVIVFNDAPPEISVQAAVASAFKLSGQRCVSAGRILVERDVFDKFAEKFVAETKKLKVGSPYGEEANFGPLINKSQMERVLKFNELTRKNPKVKVLLDGKRLERKGWFLTPHVYVSEWDTTPEHMTENGDEFPFLRQEVFGPHVALIPFDTVEDAVRIYNDTDYGLSMACITTNMNTARHMRDNCDFGLGYHNLPCVGAESHLPFGGVKASGSGGGSAAGTFHAVTNEVTWTANFQPNGFQFCQGMK